MWSLLCNTTGWQNRRGRPKQERDGRVHAASLAALQQVQIQAATLLQVAEMMLERMCLRDVPRLLTDRTHPAARWVKCALTALTARFMLHHHASRCVYPSVHLFCPRSASHSDTFTLSPKDLICEGCPHPLNEWVGAEPLKRACQPCCDPTVLASHPSTTRQHGWDRAEHRPHS